MSYQFLEHTGELAVKVKTKTLEELFTLSAQAMIWYLLGGFGKTKGRLKEQLRVEASDLEGLLVAWLSEILYRIAIKKRIYNHFRIQKLSKTRLWAEIRGFKIKKLLHDIKAVTHHGLSIEQAGGQYQAIITFDV